MNTVKSRVESIIASRSRNDYLCDTYLAECFSADCKTKRRFINDDFPALCLSSERGKSYVQYCINLSECSASNTIELAELLRVGVTNYELFCKKLSNIIGDAVYLKNSDNTVIFEYTSEFPLHELDACIEFKSRGAIDDMVDLEALGVLNEVHISNTNAPCILYSSKYNIDLIETAIDTYIELTVKSLHYNRLQ